MRIYLPVNLAELSRWAAGHSVEVEGYVANSESEEDELAALESAAADAQAVAVAEVSDADRPIEWARVEAVHLDADNSGDLAWYGPSELADVMNLVRARTST